jgi:hypothetical protein
MMKSDEIEEIPRSGQAITVSESACLPVSTSKEISRMGGGATPCVGRPCLCFSQPSLESVRHFFMVYEIRYSRFRTHRSITDFEGKFGRCSGTIFQNFGPTRSHVRNMERAERSQLSDSPFAETDEA